MFPWVHYDKYKFRRLQMMVHTTLHNTRQPVQLLQWNSATKRKRGGGVGEGNKLLPRTCHGTVVTNVLSEWFSDNNFTENYNSQPS